MSSPTPEPPPSPRPRIAVVTPSYGPDFERCSLLVESCRACLPTEVAHWLVVQSDEVERFAAIAGDRAQVLAAEELLPSWIAPPRGQRPLWLSLRGAPLFTGWRAQQLLKLAAVDAIDADVVIFCDSDSAFVRPLDLDAIALPGGHTPLRRLAFTNDEQWNWSVSAADALGVGRAALRPVSYIDNFVTWRSEVVLALRHRLAEVAGRSWQEAFLADASLTEYTLYGVFAEHVLGVEAARHVPTDTPMVLNSWGSSIRSRDDIDALFDRLLSDHVAVMVHSKDEVPLEWYSGRVRASWTP
jgi:hypothetical protein